MDTDKYLRLLTELSEAEEELKREIIREPDNIHYELTRVFEARQAILMFHKEHGFDPLRDNS